MTSSDFKYIRDLYNVYEPEVDAGRCHLSLTTFKKRIIWKQSTISHKMYKATQF